jgi:hypothetical protein
MLPVMTFAGVFVIGLFIAAKVVPRARHTGSSRSARSCSASPSSGVYARCTYGS